MENKMSLSCHLDDHSPLYRKKNKLLVDEVGDKIQLKRYCSENN